MFTLPVATPITTRTLARLRIAALIAVAAACAGGDGASAPVANAPGAPAANAPGAPAANAPDAPAASAPDVPAVTTASVPADPAATPPRPADPPAPAASAPTPPAAPAIAPPPAIPGYHLAWSDEMNGPTLDTAKWAVVAPGQPDHGGDISDPATMTFDGGIMTNKVWTDANGIHHLGLLTTQGVFETEYGYYESRIRFRGAPGEWCGFWIQSPTRGLVMDNTAVSGTEIDVMEYRKFDNSDVYIGDTGALNLNWNGQAITERKTFGKQVSSPNTPLEGNWHTYAVNWTDSGYTWYIDDVPVWQTSTAVSQRTEFMLLTCQVADWRWAGGIPAGGYGSEATSQIGMDVDYVRVWQQ